MLSAIASMDTFQWLGFAGMLCIVTAYFLLQSQRYDIHSPTYQWLNLSGAVLLLISLCVHFNLGSFIIEVFWIIITLYGMIKSRKHNENPRQ